MDNLITIGPPKIKELGDKTRCVATLLFDHRSEDVWFEVPAAYGKYLCFERSDAFLLGVLFTAVHKGYDIRCEAPVSESLMHNIERHLLPALAKAVKGVHIPEIVATLTSEELPCSNAVGTGLSCGLDSMHVLKEYYKCKYPNYAITHFAIYNVGAYYLEGVQFPYQIVQAREVAAKLGLPLIETDSNLHKVFPREHRLAVKYSNGFAIYMLQKLWGKYLYGTDGFDFTDRRQTDLDLEDSAWGEAIFALTLSTKRLEFVLDRIACTRFDKVRDLVDFEWAQKYLDCCTQRENAEPHKNCGICGKCGKTLIYLDAIGGLEKFAHVFDIVEYKKKIKKFHQRCVDSYVWNVNNDWETSDAMPFLRSRISWTAFLSSYLRLKFQFLKRLPVIGTIIKSMHK